MKRNYFKDWNNFVGSSTEFLSENMHKVGSYATYFLF